MAPESKLLNHVGWQFLCENANLLLVILDHTGIIRYANRYTEFLTGQKLQGAPLSDILLVDSWDSSMLECYMKKTTPELMNIRTAQGLTVTVHVTLYLVDTDYILFGQDDPEELNRVERELLRLNNDFANLTRELNQKNAELTELNALKNQFLGMASHDLRNPVSIILNYVGFLIRELSSGISDEHLAFLEIIQSSSLRMKRVINDFLDVSVIESGHLNLEIQHIEISVLVNNVRSMVGLFAALHKISIELLLDPTIQKLDIDGPKIEQVLVNFLNNAIEYSPDGALIIIGCEQNQAGIRFWVRDQGKGIPLDHQQRLFRSFEGSSAKKKDGERSIGLGLIIARKIVEAHHGRMFVESEPGQGSIFSFILPGSCLARLPDE